MIAPRKKKFIKLFVLAWSVVLVITGSALPVLAASPLPTDDSGNWDPSNFTATWYIFNVDTQSYSFVNVTSSVTREGLVFSFPYNLYGVTALRMYLYLPSTSYLVSNFSFEGYVFYDTSGRGSYLTPFSSSSLVYFSNSEHAIVASSYFSGNPFGSSLSVNNFGSYFVFEFHPNEVSGNFTVTFSSLLLNSEDILSSVSVGKFNALDDSTEDLDDSVEALETALPLPTFDASAFASAEAIADDYTFFNDGLRFTFMESDLVTHIFILVVYFTCLSIAIFGHAGG